MKIINARVSDLLASLCLIPALLFRIFIEADILYSDYRASVKSSMHYAQKYIMCTYRLPIETVYLTFYL